MGETVHVTFRPITPIDEPVLWDMVYHAIHVPEGTDPPPRSVITTPSLSVYVQEWGREGDFGFFADSQKEKRPIGAAWLRLVGPGGYGYVDSLTPELSVAILPGFRGKGVGTKLLARLLSAARERYDTVSLSVSPDNPAIRLYQRFGFERVGTEGDAFTMVRKLA